MNDPHVAVFHDKFSPGANTLEELTSSGRVQASEHLRLSEALERDWRSDAHFVCYHAVDEDKEAAFARFNKRAPFLSELRAAGGEVQVSLLVFDHDLHDDDDKKVTWDEETFGDFAAKLCDDSLPHYPTYWYTTRHGSRFVFVLTDPVSPERAEGLMAGIMRDYALAGVDLDPACCDWTRMFRLPSVVRDGIDTKDEPFFERTDAMGFLDPATVRPGEAKQVDQFTAVDVYVGDMPTPEEANELLWQPASRGRSKMTDQQKMIRRQLRGRASFDYAFKHRPIGQEMFDHRPIAGWDDELMKIVGQIVGMTARQPLSSPELCFAAIHQLLEQMNESDEEHNHRDWLADGWNKVCRAWTNEAAQIAREKAEKEEDKVRADVVRERLMEATEKSGESGRQDWEGDLEQRMILSYRSVYFLMRPDGYYNPRTFTQGTLLPAIRDLGMDSAIQVMEWKGNKRTTRKMSDILQQYCTPISSLTYSCRGSVPELFGPPGNRGLKVPIHELNRTLEPAWDEEIDEWLKALFGESYGDGVLWLAHALDVHAPICALNLMGASGAGKDMLAIGLSECFESGEKIDGPKIFTERFNDELLRTPVVHFEESVPTRCHDNTMPDEKFRALVTGGPMPVQAKFEGVVQATIYPRLIFTNNNQDVLRAILGKRDLTSHDIEAVECRLLNIEVGEEAPVLLRSKGGRKHTGNWVEQGRRLARHILYLFENRPEPESGRLLVEGYSGSTLLRDMQLSTETTTAVIRSVVHALERVTQLPEGWHIHEGRLWVRVFAVQQYYEKWFHETMRVKMNMQKVSKALQQLSIGGPKAINPPGHDGEDRRRWWELDTALILRTALMYGLPDEKLREMVAESSGAHELERILSASVASRDEDENNEDIG